MWWMGWPHRWWDEIPYFDGEITTFDYPSTLNSISLDFHHQKHWISPSKNLGDILNSLHFHHLRSLFRTSLGGSATAGLALFHALRRRTKHRAAARLTRRSAAQPIFCSALSSQGDWRAAVAELVAEATYQLLEEKWWNDEENCWKMMVKMWYLFFISWGFSTMQKGWLRWVLCLRWVKSHQPGMETAGVETEIYLVQNANKIQKPRWSWLEREIDHIFRSGYYFSASFGGRYAW